MNVTSSSAARSASTSLLMLNTGTMVTAPSLREQYMAESEYASSSSTSDDEMCAEVFGDELLAAPRKRHRAVVAAALPLTALSKSTEILSPDAAAEASDTASASASASSSSSQTRLFRFDRVDSFVWEMTPLQITSLQSYCKDVSPQKLLFALDSSKLPVNGRLVATSALPSLEAALRDGGALLACWLVKDVCFFDFQSLRLRSEGAVVFGVEIVIQVGLLVRSSAALGLPHDVWKVSFRDEFARVCRTELIGKSFMTFLCSHFPQLRTAARRIDAGDWVVEYCAHRVDATGESVRLSALPKKDYQTLGTAADGAGSIFSRCSSTASWCGYNSDSYD